MAGVRRLIAKIVFALACLAPLAASAGAITIDGQPLGAVAVELTTADGDVLAGPQPAGAFAFTFAPDAGAASSARGYSIVAYTHPSTGLSYANAEVTPFASWADTVLTTTQRALVGGLFTQFYSAATDALTSAAFQIALWEIVEELSGSFGVGTGDFRVAGAGSAAALADGYLAALVGASAAEPNLTAFAQFDGIALVRYVPGGTTPPGSIPEPGSGMLIAMLGLVMLGRRNHKKKNHRPQGGSEAGQW